MEKGSEENKRSKYFYHRWNYHPILKVKKNIDNRFLKQLIDIHSLYIENKTIMSEIEKIESKS